MTAIRVVSSITLWRVTPFVLFQHLIKGSWANRIMKNYKKCLKLTHLLSFGVFFFPFSYTKHDNVRKKFIFIFHCVFGNRKRKCLKSSQIVKNILLLFLFFFFNIIFKRTSMMLIRFWKFPILCLWFFHI